MLRAIMGIRAHPRLTSASKADERNDLGGPLWHPVWWLRRADRSSISSIHLADLGGKVVELTYVII